jgi:hypothetical protein
VWLSFGCWHCGQFESDAAVVFHMLRRERVFERDIFRFGTGTVTVLLLFYSSIPITISAELQPVWGKYRLILG